MKHKRNAAKIVSGVVLAAGIRCLDFPKMLSRVSYYDITECYEYIQKNPYAEQPYVSTWIFCSFIPIRYFRVFIFLCDLLTALCLDSMSYLVLSSFFSPDVSSVTNLLFSLSHTGFPSGRSVFSAFGNILINVWLLEFTGESFKPGVNLYWYMNLQMIEQYREMHIQIFFIMHLLFLSLSCLSHSLATRIFLGMMFKESGYKGYLLLWSIIELEKKKITFTKEKILSLLKSLTLLFLILEHIIWIMFVVYGIGNMNFLCWVTVLFISSSAGGALLLEIEKKAYNTDRTKKKE